MNLNLAILQRLHTNSFCYKKSKIYLQNFYNFLIPNFPSYQCVYIYSHFYNKTMAVNNTALRPDRSQIKCNASAFQRSIPLKTKKNIARKKTTTHTAMCNTRKNKAIKRYKKADTHSALNEIFWGNLVTKFLAQLLARIFIFI